MPSDKQQRGLVIRESFDIGFASNLLVGKTLFNEYGSGTSVGKVGSIDMALAHFTNEAQINTMNGQVGIGTGWVVEAQLASTTTAGQLVALFDFDGGAYQIFDLVDNTLAISKNQLGICLIGGNTNDVTQVLIKGFYCTSEATYYNNPSSKGAGVPLYIDSSSGVVTSDAPTASGSYVRIIGDVWLSQQGTNSGSSTIIYFNPQNVFSYIE